MDVLIVAKNALTLVQRTTLKGEEVDAFNEVRAWLRDLIAQLEAKNDVGNVESGSKETA